MSTTPAVPAGLPALPQHPDVDHWRPAVRADIDDIVALCRAMDPFDNPHRVTSRDEIADRFDHAWIDMAADSLLAIAADGTLVAYAMVILSPSRDVSVYSYVFGGVHPAWRERGIGRVLLAWSLERSEQQLASVETGAPASILVENWRLVLGGAGNYRPEMLQTRAQPLGRYFTQESSPVAISNGTA